MGKVVFPFDFLTYLYHNNSFFQFIAHNDLFLLVVTGVLTFVCFFNRWYVGMLVSSLFLLLFNMFFIFELPILPMQWLSGYARDYAWFQLLCLFVGIWALIRSMKEVKTMVLDNERIIERYNHMIEQGAGREQWFLGEVEKQIIDANLPGVSTAQEPVSPGFLLGEKRTFLVVRHARYKEYRLFIMARSYGQHLDAGWFLVVNPSLYKRTVSKYATGDANALSQKLDFFSQQDLGAFSTVCHHIFKRVVEMLHEELKLDSGSLYNTQSKGFLNVW